MQWSLNSNKITYIQLAVHGLHDAYNFVKTTIQTIVSLHLITSLQYACILFARLLPAEYSKYKPTT